MNKKDLRLFLLLGLALVVFHAAVFGMFLDRGVNIILWCSNLFVIFSGILLRKKTGSAVQTLYLYPLGYLMLFILIFAISDQPLLFSLFIILYAAFFHVPVLLGYLFLFIFSVIMVSAYWFQCFIMFSLIYTVLIRLRSIRQRTFHKVLFLVGLVFVFTFLFPVFYLTLQSSPQTLVISSGESEFQKALVTSLVTSTVSTLIILIFGVPLAYGLVRFEFPGKQIVDSLIDIPILLPQSVVGISLLVLLGPKTPLGAFVEESLGISISGSITGIILCQIFVSFPFLVRGTMNAFETMGEKLENVSRSLGASAAGTFFRVSLPLARGAVFDGCILSWSRAISEFGSIMILAYHPYTISVYTYDQFIQYGLKEARPIAILLTIICLWLFIVLRWIRYQPLFGVKRKKVD